MQSNAIKRNQTQSNAIKRNQTQSNAIKRNQTQSYQDSEIIIINITLRTINYYHITSAMVKMKIQCTAFRLSSYLEYNVSNVHCIKAQE